MKRLLLSSTGFCLSLVVFASFADMPAPTFDELDVNADGYISQQEGMKYKNMSKNWAKIDTNKDGRTDINEFTKFEATGRFEPPEDAEISEPGAAPM